MPTTAQATFGAGGVIPSRNPEDVTVRAVNLKASSTFAAGALVGEVTATPGTYATYATGNVDGSQNPVGILQYACVTDASGNISFGAGPAGTSEWGQTRKDAPVYLSGVFQCADIPNLDAGAVTKCGRLSQGTVTAGEFLLYGP